MPTSSKASLGMNEFHVFEIRVEEKNAPMILGPLTEETNKDVAFEIHLGSEG